MAYRINLYEKAGDSITEMKDRKHLLYLDQAEKAIVTFEMDIAACYIYRRLVAHVFGSDDVIRRLEKDEEPTEAEMDKLDNVFEDMLALLEFYLNRMTSLGDPAIERMMIHLRFTAAYLLHIDAARAAKHKHPRSNKKLNTAMFRHDQKDDLTEISHLDYKRCDLKKLVYGNEMDYRKICEVLDTVTHKEYREYYRFILDSIDGDGPMYVRLADSEEGSDEERIWKTIVKDTYPRKGRLFTGLFDLVDAMIASSPDFLRYYVREDMRDMSYGRIAVNAPAMGEIRNRDDDLESSLHTIEEVLKAYPDGLMSEICFAVRILDTVFGNSVEDRGRLELTMSFRGMIRMLNPMLFGWNYVLPPVVFCMDDPSYHERFIHGIKEVSKAGVLILEPISVAQSQWTFGKRMKASSRANGGLCRIPSPFLVKPKDLPEFMATHKTPSVFATDDRNFTQVSAYLSSFTKTEDRNKVISITVISEIREIMTFTNSMVSYTTVTITDMRHPFDFMTYYTIPLIELVMNKYLESMSSKLGVEEGSLSKIEAKDFVSLFVRHFAVFCDEMKAAIANVRAKLP